MRELLALTGRHLRTTMRSRSTRAALVLFAVGLGADVGWGVRVIPNQLYYGFFVPFVFFRFRARS